MVLRDGVLLFAQPGALPAAALDEIIGKVKALDMDDVRSIKGVIEGFVNRLLALQSHVS